MRLSTAQAQALGITVPGMSPDKSTKHHHREVEGEEQAILIEWFRMEYPDKGHLLIHIPNGGSRKNAFEGYRLKRQGVKAGVSDLLLPVARGGYFGLWIEFKATPPDDAPVTDSQKAWVFYMNEEGYLATVCSGLDAAMGVLRRYMAWVPTVVK